MVIKEGRLHDCLKAQDKWEIGSFQKHQKQKEVLFDFHSFVISCIMYSLRPAGSHQGWILTMCYAYLKLESFPYLAAPVKS